ncbi:unnamed protein product [Trichobilharzia regenti]|nr:unnamed protein product [Trichobilharzia regenti]
MRREQDLAYEASLAEDRAKVAAREAQQRSAALAAEQLAREAKRKEDLQNAHQKRKLVWQRRLPPQPKFQEGSTVQLSFKMPQGSRVSQDSPTEFEIQSNFPKRVLPCQPSEESDIEDYIDNSDHKVDSLEEFEVITDWRSKSQDDPPSFLEVGLTKSELLFVLNKNA